jgi:hypothetical protein
MKRRVGLVWDRERRQLKESRSLQLLLPIGRWREEVREEELRGGELTGKERRGAPEKAEELSEKQLQPTSTEL